MMGGSVSLSDGALRELSREIKDASSAYVKVGVLGGYARRERGQTGVNRWKEPHPPKGGQLTNAEIGVIHEFGSPDSNIPERSFLRMPILSRLDGELRKVPLVDWQRTLLTGGLVAVLRIIGQASLNLIKDAFHTEGWGRWAKLKWATIRRKGSSDVLVDSTQLERSVTFAVVAKGAPRKAIR